jgi:hypothetical protein
MAFSGTRYGDSEIWTMRADGSAETNLTQNTTVTDREPA